jgi:hypothetical protein
MRSQDFTLGYYPSSLREERRNLGDGYDAVFGSEGEQLGGWSTRLLFATLPLADDPGGEN